jgi:hypothetical protein
MRPPSGRGAPIDGRRYRSWVMRFGSYRDPVTNATIENWLQQFERRDRDLAARILDAVEFYGQGQIHASYRQALTALPGWSPTLAERVGRWRFAAMSGSAGESGDAMLHQFRVANRLDLKRFNDLFVSRSDLFRQTMLPEDDPKFLGPEGVVVLLDDFSGTGEQVCRAWNNPETSFGALLAGVGKIYLILVAASRSARERILAETEISPLPAHELGDCDDVFSERCTHFSATEKDRLVHYGRIADRKDPRGFGNCGLLIVFQHRAPNNSIPILHKVHDRWTGLFPRNE